MSPSEPELTPADLAQIVPPANVSQEPAPETALEKKDLDYQRLKLVLAGLEQDTSERKRYAERFFWLSCGWIVIITLILVLEGFGICKFKLSDAVVLATIGSTTINILGILYIVANYLFPRK